MGTPDYISPEVLCAVNVGQDRYGAECDWWSLGCVIWQMLFGAPPFYDENEINTYEQIMRRANDHVSLTRESRQ